MSNSTQKTWVVFLFLFNSIVCHSQILDFRNATLEKANGEYIEGKLGYTLGFPPTESLSFKQWGKRKRIPLSDLKRFSVNGVEYEVLQDPRTPDSYMAARIISKGKLQLLQSRGEFFLVYNDTTYYFDGRKKTKRVGSRIQTTKSGLYVSLIHDLFKDCQLDYRQITLKLNQETLVTLFDRISQCRGYKFSTPTRAKRFEVGVLGGVGTSQFETAAFYAGVKSNTTLFGTTGLTLTRDLIGYSKLKIRVDVNFREYAFSGSLTRATSYSEKELLPRRRNELVNYGLNYSAIEIPFGLQYYLFKKKAGLYINVGTTIFSAGSSYLDVDAYEALTTETFIPRYKFKLDARTDTHGSGYWFGSGFEMDLPGRMTFFAEARYEKNSSVKIRLNAVVRDNNPSGTYEDLKITEVSSRFGIKFHL